MAQYTPKRKYTKKPSTTLKKVVKKVKKETVEAVEAVDGGAGGGGEADDGKHDGNPLQHDQISSREIAFSSGLAITVILRTRRARTKSRSLKPFSC